MSAIIVIGVAVASVLSLIFSTLTFSLRDFSRSRLADALDRRGKGRYLDKTIDRAEDLVFITAVWRLLSNLLILIGALILVEAEVEHPLLQYALAGGLATMITLFVSVTIPTAAARHAAAPLIAAFVAPLHALHWTMWPVTRIMRWIDATIARAAGRSAAVEQEQIENEILSVVEEGEKEGVVDEEEREMIESVIEFRSIHAGQIMTARPEIVALPLSAPLDQVKRVIEESGHSRIPVYDGTLDQIVGVLYARDLLKHVGAPPERFNIRSAMRPAFMVPETKPLRDLLDDFRAQKVHMAIVMDEYGGTAGLVTIEDLLEELVGDISDEHEPQEPAMLKQVDDNTSEADGRMYVDELNRYLGLSLPEDAGYSTLGGFISTTLGRIPPAGTVFEHNGVRFTILEAEPQRVDRVRIERPQPPASPPDEPSPEAA